VTCVCLSVCLSPTRQPLSAAPSASHCTRWGHPWANRVLLPWMWLFADVTAAPIHQWGPTCRRAFKAAIVPSSQYHVTSGAGTAWLDNIVALWKRISPSSEDRVFGLEMFLPLCGLQIRPGSPCTVKTCGGTAMCVVSFTPRPLYPGEKPDPSTC
jgi:hypothetical protein